MASYAEFMGTDGTDYQFQPDGPTRPSASMYNQFQPDRPTVSMRYQFQPDNPTRPSASMFNQFQPDSPSASMRYQFQPDSPSASMRYQFQPDSPTRPSASMYQPDNFTSPFMSMQTGPEASTEFRYAHGHTPMRENLSSPRKRTQSHPHWLKPKRQRSETYPPVQRGTTQPEGSLESNNSESEGESRQTPWKGVLPGAAVKMQKVVCVLCRSMLNSNVEIQEHLMAKEHIDAILQHPDVRLQDVLIPESFVEAVLTEGANPDDASHSNRPVSENQFETTENTAHAPVDVTPQLPSLPVTLPGQFRKQPESRLVRQNLEQTHEPLRRNPVQLNVHSSREVETQTMDGFRNQQAFIKKGSEMEKTSFRITDSELQLAKRLTMQQHQPVQHHHPHSQPLHQSVQHHHPHPQPLLPTPAGSNGKLSQTQASRWPAVSIPSPSTSVPNQLKASPSLSISSLQPSLLKVPKSAGDAEVMETVIHCKACNVIVPNQFHWDAHTKTVKHKEKMQMIEETKRKLEQVSPPVRIKPESRRPHLPMQPAVNQAVRIVEEKPTGRQVVVKSSQTVQNQEPTVWQMQYVPAEDATTHKAMVPQQERGQELQCGLCNLTVHNRLYWDAHVKSPRHLSKNRDTSLKPQEYPDVAFYCSLCEVYVTCEANFADHVSGKKHRGNLEKSVAQNPPQLQANVPFRKSLPKPPQAQFSPTNAPRQKKPPINTRSEAPTEPVPSATRKSPSNAKFLPIVKAPSTPSNSKTSSRVGNRAPTVTGSFQDAGTSSLERQTIAKGKSPQTLTVLKPQVKPTTPEQDVKRRVVRIKRPWRGSATYSTTVTTETNAIAAPRTVAAAQTTSAPTQPKAFAVPKASIEPKGPKWESIPYNTTQPSSSSNMPTPLRRRISPSPTMLLAPSGGNLSAYSKHRQSSSPMGYSRQKQSPSPLTLPTSVHQDNSIRAQTRPYPEDGPTTSGRRYHEDDLSVSGGMSPYFSGPRSSRIIRMRSPALSDKITEHGSEAPPDQYREDEPSRLPMSEIRFSKSPLRENEFEEEFCYLKIHPETPEFDEYSMDSEKFKNIAPAIVPKTEEGLFYQDPPRDLAYNDATSYSTGPQSYNDATNYSAGPQSYNDATSYSTGPQSYNDATSYSTGPQSYNVATSYSAGPQSSSDYQNRSTEWHFPNSNNSHTSSPRKQKHGFPREHRPNPRLQHQFDRERPWPSSNRTSSPSVARYNTGSPLSSSSGAKRMILDASGMPRLLPSMDYHHGVASQFQQPPSLHERGRNPWQYGQYNFPPHSYTSFSTTNMPF